MGLREYERQGRTEREWRQEAGPCVLCAECGALVPLSFASRFSAVTFIPCVECGASARYELDRHDVAV
jgi:RNase P subunit RPR2